MGKPPGLRSIDAVGGIPVTEGGVRRGIIASWPPRGCGSPDAGASPQQLFPPCLSCGASL